MDIFPNIFEELLFRGGERRVHGNHKNSRIHLGQVIIGHVGVVAINRPHPGGIDDPHPILQVIGRVGDIDFSDPLPIAGVTFLGDVFQQFRPGDRLPSPF